MARTFLTNIDLKQNEVQNGVIQNLAAAPGTPKAGQVYYDTVKKGLGFYTGSAWIYPTESGGVSEAEAAKLGTIMVKGDLSGSGTTPTVVHFTLSSDSSAGTHKITALAEPTEAQDAATKAYVDGKVNGLAWKQPVLVATTAALPAVTAAGSGATKSVTANANGILEVDGIKVETLNRRILVKNQASAVDNGIYTITTLGTAGVKFILTRAADAISEAQVIDATVLAEEGTENADHVFNMTGNPGAAVVDTNNLVWVEIQSGTSVTGDAVYTTRTGAKIGVIAAEAAAAAPADGAVATISKGTARKVITAIKGNEALTEFTITHELKTRNLVVQAQEDSTGNPTKPIEFDWETSGAEKIVVKFPTALAKTTYHITIIG